MSTIEEIRHQNLLLIVKELGSQRALSNLLEKSYAQINQWVNRIPDSKTGKPRSISSAMCRDVERKLGKPNGWMDIDHSELNVVEFPLFKNGAVPLISWVQAGMWCETIDNFQPGDAEMFYPCPVAHGPHTYALKVRGFSMFNPGGSPSFNEGDIIFVDPDKQYQHKSLVIVKKAGEDFATFKQLVVEGDKKYLTALNPNWPEKIIHLSEDATVCGIIIAKLETF